MQETFERVVDRKDAILRSLARDIEEAEDQYPHTCRHTHTRTHTHTYTHTRTHTHARTHAHTRTHTHTHTHTHSLPQLYHYTNMLSLPLLHKRHQMSLRHHLENVDELIGTFMIRYCCLH